MFAISAVSIFLLLHERRWITSVERGVCYGLLELDRIHSNIVCVSTYETGERSEKNTCYL